MHIVTTDNIEAHDAGKAAAEAHPLTVYIEAGNFVVCEGRETLLTTDSPAALMCFFNAWHIAYIADHDADVAATGAD